MKKIFLRALARVLCMVYGHSPLIVSAMKNGNLMSINVPEGTLVGVQLCRLCGVLYWIPGDIKGVRTADEIEIYDYNRIVADFLASRSSKVH